MTKIYIARHGQDEDNAQGILNGRRDMSLTAIGLEQAAQLARHIQESGLTFDKVYSSPLQRAFKTAETVAATLGLAPPEKLDLLIERDFGVMTGKPIKDIAALCGEDIIQTETITYFLAPENAETFPVVLERAQRALDFVQSGHAGKSILLVCHGDLGKMLYAAFYKQGWKDILCHFHFGNGELLLLEDGCDASTRHVLKLDQYNH